MKVRRKVEETERIAAPPGSAYEEKASRQMLRVGACIALLFALTLVVFWDHWRAATSFTFDFPMGYYAGTAYWISSMQAGEWPHWIPYESMGAPALLSPQLAMFYPPFWLIVLFRIPYTLYLANIVQVLHVWFGAVGFLILARRMFRSNAVALCGAVCFCLFGGFFTNSEHPDVIRGFAWAPWVFCCLLLDDRLSGFSFKGRMLATRLGRVNLLLPPIMAWFFCGAYPGVVVSTLVVAGIFLCAQTLVLWRSGEQAVAIRDTAIQFGGIVCGMIVAAVFLIPTALLSPELSRTHTFGLISRSYLGFRDLLHLVFPSNLISNTDYAMYGMQLPVMPLLFAPLAISRCRLLAPFLASGAVAALMSFGATSSISGALIRLVPALGFSRFPAGDYRLFIYLPVLLCGLAGLDAALRARRERAWVNVSILLVVVAALFLETTRLFAGLDLHYRAACLRLVYLFAFCSAVSIAAYIAWLRVPRARPLCLAAFLAVLMLNGAEVVFQMRNYWSDPMIERTFYDGRGLPLERNGRLTAAGIFSRSQTARPARRESQGFLDLSWRGYIDGSYMINDNVKSISEQQVWASPELMGYMRQGSRISLVPCNAQFCQAGFAQEVPLTGATSGATLLAYGRNYALFEVDDTREPLVVENELFAPGWTAICETHQEHFTAHRVDRALRGWVLPPGRHRIREEYRTPGLYAGALLSGTGYLFWGAAFLVFARRCAKSQVAGR